MPGPVRSLTLVILMPSSWTGGYSSPSAAARPVNRVVAAAPTTPAAPPRSSRRDRPGRRDAEVLGVDTSAMLTPLCSVACEFVTVRTDPATHCPHRLGNVAVQRHTPPGADR